MPTSVPSASRDLPHLIRYLKYMSTRSYLHHHQRHNHPAIMRTLSFFITTLLASTVQSLPQAATPNDIAIYGFSPLPRHILNPRLNCAIVKCDPTVKGKPDSDYPNVDPTCTYAGCHSCIQCPKGNKNKGICFKEDFSEPDYDADDECEKLYGKEPVAKYDPAASKSPNGQCPNNEDGTAGVCKVGTNPPVKGVLPGQQPGFGAPTCRKSAISHCC